MNYNKYNINTPIISKNTVKITKTEARYIGLLKKQGG